MTTYQRQRQPFAAYGRRGLPKTTAQDHDMTRNQRLDNEYNNNQSMSNKPTSILKKTPSKKQPPQQYQNGWQPTSYRSNQDTTHIDFIPSRPLYSPVSTPPRLRALITPPGIEPYRNRYNLRLFTSPLPSLDDWQPPLSLDTWGIDPVDYRFNNPNLYRLQPSPLSHYGLPGSKQKKSYIVVPRLQNVSSATMSRQNSSKFKPDPRYPYLETTASAKSTRLLREPSDYVYLRSNEAFANRYIDDFIGKCIEDEYIPDILIELIAELEKDNKNIKPEEKSFKQDIDQYYAQLNNNYSDDTGRLFSDQWIKELEYRRPIITTTTSNINSNLSLFNNIDLKEVHQQQSITTTFDYQRMPKFSQLPPNTQEKILTDINQDIIDFEIENMITEITGQTLGSQLQNVPMVGEMQRQLYHEIENEVIRETLRDLSYETLHSYHTQIDQVQLSAVSKHAENKLLDTLCLDDLIRRYIKQNGSVADVDDLSRLLDSSVLSVLIYQYQDIRETRARTLDNYAFRKFHLNAFMNIAMDLLLTELSASLIEDMKDVDEVERRNF